jgi:hypothetical protein
VAVVGLELAGASVARVHRGEADREAERRVRGAAVDEFERLSAEACGLVGAGRIPGVDEIRTALALFAAPEIEVGFSGLDGGGLAHAKLADESGAVTGAAQPHGVGVRPLGFVQAGGEVRDPVAFHPLAGEETRAADRADRGGDKTFLEDDPLRGQSVEVGCLHERVAHESGSVPAEVVDDDEHEVGPGGGRGRFLRAGGERRCQQEGGGGRQPKCGPSVETPAVGMGSGRAEGRRAHAAIRCRD